VELSVIIPVYCSQATLPELIERLLAVLDDTGKSCEIVLVDDASTDDSWATICQWQQAHAERIVAVQLMRNCGQHNALMCGLRLARGRYVITMDDDLQNPPEEIPKLLGAIEAGRYDLVYGVPLQKQHASWRNLGSLLVSRFYRTIFASKVRLSSFRIIRRELVAAIASYELNYTFLDGLLAWNTQYIGQVPVEHRARSEGRSGYSLGKLLVLAINLFTNFSLLPLQLVSLLGFLTALGGFALGAYYTYGHLSGRITVPGYASTITAVFVLGGIQLLALGVMGEYLGRLHMNVNCKPQYTLRTVLGPTDRSLAPACGPVTPGDQPS
jgi:undecaprenyl-phosphate 4-deoxy-4-formamido-L-arabinose transferase